MKILIVGASGLVGSHCVNALKNDSHEVIGTYLNFQTPETVYFDPLSSSDKSLNINHIKPEIIIHCGALTNVDYCENNEEESKIATVSSTEALVNYCKQNNVKLVYISTDYVFDGEQGPYQEEAITNPINVYGKHKLEAELLVKSLDKYLIIRVTNVYGEEERSKNFIARLAIWLKNNETKKLDLPIDQFATPVYAGDIARMLSRLISDYKTGIYNLSSTDYYDRYRLALKVKSYFPDNTSVSLNPVQTHNLNQAAKRPLNGGLLNIKFIQQYPDFEFSNVDSFMNRINNQ